MDRDPSSERLREVHRASLGVARETPILSASSLSRRCGGRIVLKAENLQRTGSFKLRGALSKLGSIGDAPGVVTASAGNHGQAVAYAAREVGLPCEVFMPHDASLSKLAAVHDFGAEIRREGRGVDDCIALATERAAESGMVFVHPFDDDDVIRGQAGVGVELIDQIPDLRKVVVSIGGGGLASGVCLALAAERPDVEVVGVQVSSYGAMAASLGEAVAPEAGGRTIADGIAVKRPGERTRAILERLLAGIVLVGEAEIAAAMVALAERSKLVVEGAGAAPLAALLTGVVEPSQEGTTALVLSGGNVDPGLLATIVARAETSAGRRLRITTVVSDRPGALAGLLGRIAETGANLITVDHVRDGIDLALGDTAVALTLETRGADHAESLLAELRSSYEVDVELMPPR
ncbi:pyridoxal-phosphate dependent enzyme [Thermoleophilia bacterium SCSIO 60948]|nr:pyridoxal-phosphate dependent enzyme [Thermoleophilia bacterium SCSIO 60948]